MPVVAARAVVLGERIDTAGPDRKDALSASPLSRLETIIVVLILAEIALSLIQLGWSMIP